MYDKSVKKGVIISKMCMTQLTTHIKLVGIDSDSNLIEHAFG